MTINKVFCYSKDIAKQNGNKLPILQLTLTAIIGIILIILLAVSMEFNIEIFVLIIFLWICVLIYYSFVLGDCMKSRMTGYAT